MIKLRRTEDPAAARVKRPLFAHLLRIFALPIIIGWVLLTVAVNVFIPQLEVISEEHSAPLAPMEGTVEPGSTNTWAKLAKSPHIR